MGPVEQIALGVCLKYTIYVSSSLLCEVSQLSVDIKSRHKDPLRACAFDAAQWTAAPPVSNIC